MTTGVDSSRDLWNPMRMDTGLHPAPRRAIHAWRRRAWAVGLALLVSACGAGADGGAPDTVDVDTAPGDVGPADTGMSVDAVTAGEIVLGTNPAGFTEPSDFRALSDGDELNVEFGFQGLWMVVLAFKTRDLFSIGEPLFLTGELTVGGERQGTLALTDQRTIAGGDGWGYYLNFFLVVDDPRIGGRPGVVHFTARDARGHEESVDLPVMLTGGE